MKTDAERIVAKHGGTYSPGGWCRASGLDKAAAAEVAEALILRHYQVRSVLPTASGKYEVIFR